VTWLCEGAGGACLGFCCAWWREAAPATNISACPSDTTDPLATNQIAQVCSLGKAMMQLAEL